MMEDTTFNEYKYQTENPPSKSTWSQLEVCNCDKPQTTKLHCLRQLSWNHAYTATLAITGLAPHHICLYGQGLGLV